MSENKKNKFFHMPSKPSKKFIIFCTCLILMAGLTYVLFSQGIIAKLLGSGNVNFTPLEAKDVPQAIERDVIPEYRDLERALGCVVDNKVYIIVTRGEKPTAGYDLTIEKVCLEKSKSGSNLVVTAKFIEPPQEKTISRIITYPYAVAVTDLKALPDTIELKSFYE